MPRPSTSDLDLARMTDDGCPNPPASADDSATFDLLALWRAVGGTTRPPAATG
jgi:hypothetical protein